MTRLRTVGLFLALAAIWGTAFMAIKAGLDYFPPVLFAAIRYDVAGVLMLVYAAYATDRWRPRTRAEWYLVGVGGALMIAGYHALLFIGEQRTTSAVAAVIVSSSPILTTAFARVLLPEERLRPAGIAGLLLGLVGVAILAQPDPQNLLAADVVAKGLIFGAALSFALGSVLAKRSTADLPIETMEAWSMVIGAVLMHAGSALLLGESAGEIEWTMEGIGALVYLAVAASAIGFLLYFDLLDRLGPVEINLVSYVAPVFAAISGYLWLQEVLGLATLIGFLVIATGFGLLKRRELRDEFSKLQSGPPG